MATSKKIALVTGGNKGIGFAICQGLAKHNDIHVLLGARDHERGKAAIKKLEELGLKNVECVVLDVSNQESIDKGIKDILEKHKKVDILINNAGIFKDYGKPFLDANVKDIEDTFRVNTLAPLRLCQLLAPIMKANKYGRIVNLGSGFGAII